MEQYLERTDEMILQSVSLAHGFIQPYLQSLVSQQGKKLRPACVLLSHGIAADSDPTETACRLAAGVELVHLASLVHDDIIDEASYRRGKETLHKKIGSRRAIVAGDYLLARAFSLLSHEDIETVNPSIVSDRICRLCESEIDQDSEIGDFSISENHYLRRIAGKTASLFSLSCYLGAQSAEAGKVDRVRLSRLGYNLGMAFQIQDDVLDITGSRKELGKSVGKDLRSGIVTLPVLLALEHDSEGKLQQTLSRLKAHILQQETADEQETAEEQTADEEEIPKVLIAEAAELIVRLGGADAAEAAAEKYMHAAQKDLRKLPKNSFSDRFSVMMRTLLDRRH